MKLVPGYNHPTGIGNGAREDVTFVVYSCEAEPHHTMKVVLEVWSGYSQLIVTKLVNEVGGDSEAVITSGTGTGWETHEKEIPKMNRMENSFIIHPKN